jgi:hypothetical protein
MTRRSYLLPALAALALAGRADAQVLQAPDGWTARPERFVEMPPGWHITAGRGVILYNEATAMDGEYRVESEGFLFDPEGANGTYGLILGGRELDSDAQRYVAFEIDTEGRYALRLHDGHDSAELVAPTRHEAVLPWTGEEATVKNVLGVEAGADAVRFLVNGTSVAELPRADVDPDGVVGLRIDAGLNIHVTTLDVTAGGETKSWAPKRPEG